MTTGVNWYTDLDGDRAWVYLAPWCLRRLPMKIILDTCAPANGPMLVRYALVRTRWGNLYLHHFVRSDNDRHFHDHPWAFVTVLLTGGYREHVPDGESRERVHWRRRFSVLYRPATWRHYVEIVRPVWTLVFVTPRQREWGFWTRRGWIDWITYGREWCNDDAR